MMKLTRILGIFLIAFSCVACGQSYPERPIRLIVSYPPGGGTDVTARTIVGKLSEGLGRQVVIDNRPGGGSTIGTDLVAKATPDGYTLLMSDTTFGILPGLYAKLPFDALRDFQPITQITGVPGALVVHPALPAHSVRELVALAKAKPGSLNFGSGGVGTPVHMAGELLKLAANIDIVHIPYKGAGPAFTDLLGGHLQLMFPTLQSAVPHIKSGRLRLLALTGESRSPAFPDIPIMEEAGVPGVIAVGWFGIHAPRATPKTVIARVHDEAIKVLRDPMIRQRFSTEGADVVGSSPQQFAQFVAAEIAKWRKVVKDGGIKAEY